MRHDRTDGSRVYHLQKSLSTIAQGSLSVTEYYNAFRSLWDEYLDQRPIVSCSCGLCICDINTNMLALQQSDSVLKFLVGLNESYSTLRSQILLMSPLPPMSKVYSMILQEENQRELYSTSVANPLAMFTRHVKSTKDPSTRSFPNSGSEFSKFTAPNDRKKLRCTHCGFSGHSVDKCFQLIGYPPGWEGPTGKRPPPSSHSANAVSSSDSTIPSSVAAQLPTSDRDIIAQFLAFREALAVPQPPPPAETSHFAATTMSGHSHEEDNWFS